MSLFFSSFSFQRCFTFIYIGPMRALCSFSRKFRFFCSELNLYVHKLTQCLCIHHYCLFCPCVSVFFSSFSFQRCGVYCIVNDTPLFGCQMLFCSNVYIQYCVLHLHLHPYAAPFERKLCREGERAGKFSWGPEREKIIPGKLREF